MHGTLDGLAFSDNRPGRAQRVGTITPGRPADLIVVPDGPGADPASALAVLLTRPEDVLVAVGDGEIVWWHGHRVGPGRTGSAEDALPAGLDPRRVGVWTDETGFLQQELTADGRYDETRGGRAHAFTGRYRVDGDRIDYLDDLGFWAFGEFRGDTLHHAGYVMRLP